MALLEADRDYRSHGKGEQNGGREFFGAHPRFKDAFQHSGVAAFNPPKDEDPRPYGETARPGIEAVDDTTESRAAESRSGSRLVVGRSLCFVGLIGRFLGRRCLDLGGPGLCSRRFHVGSQRRLASIGVSLVRPILRHTIDESRKSFLL